jgi:hypothetical protein
MPFPVILQNDKWYTDYSKGKGDQRSLRMQTLIAIPI